MSEGGDINFNILSDGAVIVICVTLLIILFAGEPDLVDALVKYLMGE